MYSRGWGSSAWLKITSGRFVTVAALLCALSTERAQHNRLAISAFAPLARFLASLNYTPAPERSEGWAVDSLESSWTSTSLGGAGARLVDTHPLPPRLNYRWIIYSASNGAEREKGRRGRGREMERWAAYTVERILRTPAAHRTDSSGCICPIFPLRSIPRSPFLHTSTLFLSCRPARGIIKTRTSHYDTDIYIYISRGGGGVGARVHIPGGRRAENNKVRLSSGTPLAPLHLPPPSFTRPFYPSPFSRTFHFGLRTAGASLSIQFRSHLCTWGPASVHTCRRTYGGTSYLFYFIVSRSHPQAWVNIFLRDRAPTHPPLPTILSTLTTPYSLIVAVFRSRSSFPQHRHPSSPPFFRLYPGSVDIANQEGRTRPDGGRVISKFEEEDCEKLPLGIISCEAVGISFELLEFFRAAVAVWKNCFELSFYEGRRDPSSVDVLRFGTSWTVLIFRNFYTRIFI